MVVERLVGIQVAQEEVQLVATVAVGTWRCASTQEVPNCWAALPLTSQGVVTADWEVEADSASDCVCLHMCTMVQVVVGGILLLQVSNHMDELLSLANMDLNQAMAIAGKLIVDACFWLAMGLVLIALADVPIQQYQVHKKLMMSRQEVRDEMKDSEGRPEVKQKIKQRQREMANNKMMAKVKDADVVITNPQHFAVALSYDPNGEGAPILLAKGSDEMARRIREEAKAHAVELFPAPELARALYFTTQVDEPIPEGLYHAVAQVIAYVFSLNQSYAAGEGVLKPVPVVPENMRFDSNGFPV